MILSITSLLDMHPPCFPKGQRGLWISSLSADLEGLSMAKKRTDLCYAELWPPTAGPVVGRNLRPCCFPDPPDKLVTLILKAVTLTLLSSTQFPSSPFWIRDVCSRCVLPRITNWRLTVGPAPLALLLPVAQCGDTCMFNRRSFRGENGTSQLSTFITTSNGWNCLFCEHRGFLCLQFILICFSALASLKTSFECRVIHFREEL